MGLDIYGAFARADSQKSIVNFINAARARVAISGVWRR